MHVSSKFSAASLLLCIWVWSAGASVSLQSSDLLGSDSFYFKGTELLLDQTLIYCGVAKESGTKQFLTLRANDKR